MNHISAAQTQDIEHALPTVEQSTPRPLYKNILIGTCATLATAFATTGSLLLAGSIGQTGPLAVDRGDTSVFVQNATNTSHEPSRPFLGNTIPFSCFGIASLASAVLLSGFAVKLALSKP